MKEFEKWLKENGDGSLKENHDNSCNNSFIMGIWAGWRAALEWQLSWETDLESREIIEKELGD